MRFLLKKTNEQYSWSLTLAVIAFASTTLWLLLSIFTHIKGLDIRPFSGSDATLYLFPIMGNYFGGKFITAKNAVEETRK